RTEHSYDGDCHQQLSTFVYRSGEYQQIAAGRSVRHMTVGVKSRAVAGTPKIMIRFGVQLAFPVRADGRKGEQFFAMADNEESLAAENGIHSVSSIVADWPRVHHSFPADD